MNTPRPLTRQETTDIAIYQSGLAPALREPVRATGAFLTPSTRPTRLPSVLAEGQPYPAPDAKAAVVKELRSWAETTGAARAVKDMIQGARFGTLPEPLAALVAEACRDGKLTRGTLYRWLRQRTEDGGQQTDKAKDNPSSVVCSPSSDAPPWAGAFLRWYRLPSKPSIKQAMENMAGELPPGCPMPSYGQVWRYYNKLSRLDRQRGRDTGSALQMRQGYRRRDTSNLRPLDVCLCDGHSFKARVQHPIHGKPFKPEICTVIDAATRMIIGWAVGLAESNITVAEALRHAMSTSEDKPCGGIPGILYTDNGGGNLAGLNSDALSGRFARFGINHKTGRPGNPQGRGLIERSNHVWIRAAKNLATYTGKDMDKGVARIVYLATRKEAKEQGASDLCLTWPQFHAFCAETVAAYNGRPHSALPKLRDKSGKIRHLAPAEAWAGHIAGGWDASICQIDPRELETLWLPREARKVIRASVEIGGNTYFNRYLAHIDGETVQVAYDQHNAERVWIFNGHDRLLCVAEWEKNRTEYFPVAEVERSREQRAMRRAAIKYEQLAEIEAERRGIIQVTGARRQETGDREQAPAICLLTPDPCNLSPDFLIPESESDQYALWRQLDARLAAAESLGQPEAQFYESFRQSAAFAVWRENEAETARILAARRQA